MPSARNRELEEIDENEETFKMFVEDADNNNDSSPLKELRQSQCLNESMLSSMNKETLKQHIMQANFFTQRQDNEDGYSTNLNSQCGSPFRKARRTREERRRGTNNTRNFGD